MRVRVRAHSLVLPSDTAVWPSVHTLRAPGHVRHSLRCAWACPDPAGQRCPVRAQRLLKRRRRPRQHSAATVCSRTDPLPAQALPGRAPSCLKRKDFHESCLEGKQEEFAHVDCASRTELLSASVRPPPSARVKAATGAGRSRVHRGVCGSPRLRVSPLHLSPRILPSEGPGPFLLAFCIFSKTSLKMPRAPPPPARCRGLFPALPLPDDPQGQESKLKFSQLLNWCIGGSSSMFEF